MEQAIDPAKRLYPACLEGRLVRVSSRVWPWRRPAPKGGYPLKVRDARAGRTRPWSPR